jgi:hypothetical protein
MAMRLKYFILTKLPHGTDTRLLSVSQLSWLGAVLKNHEKG